MTLTTAQKIEVVLARREFEAKHKQLQTQFNEGIEQACQRYFDRLAAVDIPPRVDSSVSV